MRKLICISIFLLGFLGVSKAQEITGRVFEKETTEPLIGVTVVIENTTIGAITDLTGAYSITAREGQTLVFSYLGMET
ncbi:MAG: carboxypeptidase-like regulatory domain-containing protein [Bacteroides sp.]|nr:carboxypeptidase-like regulatory domain-containing protein [Bacteroides sp.]